METIRELRKELRLKGFDSICGFHAKLKSNLKTLIRYCSVYAKETITFDEIHQTAFLWFAIGNNRNILLKRENPFDGDLFFKFKEHAGKTIDLFNTSDGQLPLSADMLTLFETLYSSLEDIVSYSEINNTNTLGLLDIPEHHNKFILNINEIIDEIDKKTPEMLKNFWVEINSPTNNVKHK